MADVAPRALNTEWTYLKKHPPRVHLGHYAAQGPHIDCVVVGTWSHQDFRRSIQQGTGAAGVENFLFSFLVFYEVARQVEVCDLDDAVFPYQDILGLDIPMADFRPK